MNLLSKFAILVFMLGGMMLIAVGIPTWAVGTVDKNVVREQSKLVQIITMLKRIETASSDVLRRLESEPQAPLDPKGVSKQFKELNEITGQLGESSGFRQIAGTGLGASLLRRLREISSIVTDPDNPTKEIEANRVASARQFKDLNVLVALIRDQLESNVYYSIEHSGIIRALLQRVLISALVASSLVAVLAFLLLRRWVIVPVFDLRAAAREVSSGNFDYRVRIRSRDEIGALSAEINSMAGTIAEMQARTVARERLNAIEEILRRLVHNLRNPLAGIRGLAEAACLELPTESRIREDQNLIIAMVDRFEKWLSELLSSTTTLNMHLMEDSPADLVQMVLQTVQPLASSKSVDIEVDNSSIPERAEFDPMHLEHALVALTTNALEATPEGGHVRIEASKCVSNGAFSRGGEDWQIRIEDSGAGIPEEKRADIFQPYFTTKSKGTGLGLALVQNVIQAHGGRVRVGESDLGGAMFEVRLPLSVNGNGRHHG